MTPAAGRIIDLYERHARRWDADRARSLLERAWLDRLLSLLPPRGVVLDLGCGSGCPMARYIIAQAHEVTGVDASPTLVSLCKERFPTQEWVAADMRTLRLKRRFAGILAWDSFFHLSHDDQRLMFPVFRMHAAPRAALMFTSGPSHGEALGTYRGEALYHASLDPAEYRALLHEHGFEVVAHAIEDPSCGGHTIWLAQLR